MGVGAVAYKVSLLSGRGTWLSSFYALLSAPLPGMVYGVMMASQTEGMGAIPFLVLTGALTQFVVGPSFVAILLMEIRRLRTRSNGDSSQ